ncbi:protein involved in gliding motility SprE [Mesonia phycicola]|uniref:Protein involved in gliding motility SprE n=1 Tax=Mesonia phycicola TaxID=579105 RepID=A0A1M6CZ29_9FLAO|nr:tetratricopeptide repeat protein [Mesonia phycicola]SHI66282.1 protein involved in gliding motility SprE [Mesonia phycicola]
MNLKKNNFSINKPTLLAILALLLVASCSRKKNKWLNRNFHAMGAYYNIIYNGNLALDLGQQELAQTYTDNYWEILPIERMQVEEETNKPGQTKNPNFEKAEEKATKAIQKHNMRIAGEEYNPQMDEAFLLLGKARYFDQRFFPALEAFNYIITDYPESDRLITARVWREKTYMRMGNNELALQNLRKLFEEEVEFEDEDLVSASAAIAQAYLNLDEKEKAITPLNNAIEFTNSNEEKGRFLFIKGQIYDRLGEIDSANKVFDEVIALKRKTPRVYMINAYIEKAKNFDYDTEDQLAFRELLEEMQLNRENRPFLDKIYYQIGQFYKATDSIEGSVEYYNKSLRTDLQDQYLRSRNYLTLGDINFDYTEYKIAGAYYDSTLINLPDNTREYRAIKKKRENLDDVILYEDIADKNDSILGLVAMSSEERLAYFEKVTSEMKQKAIEEAERLKREGEDQLVSNPFGSTQSTAGGSGKSTFYFYNENQVTRGLKKFNKTWGDRELKDNWRYEAGSGAKGKEEELEEEEEDYLAAIENDPAFNPQTYIATIPSEEKVIDSLKRDRNFAYYQLGVIYKEKFKEYELAANKLETLLQNNPQERLILPSKYNLYKIYEIMGDTASAEKWKQNILSQHADSRYASILRNPRSLRDDESSPEAVYTSVYRKFQAEQYKEVIADSEKYIELFTGEDIVPKFELLKATASGRYSGFKAYESGLNYVALTYPQSEEGKKAEQIVKTSLPKLKITTFTKDAQEEDFKLVYPFSTNEKELALELQKSIDLALQELGYSQHYTSLDFYTENQLFVIVHNLKSNLGAEGLGELLSKEKAYNITNNNFGISTANYKIIQIHKNLNAYLSERSK